MNGAEALLETLADAGLEVCFANPGTSEMHLVAAIDRSERMRSILALFEGAVTGAADGYGRMAGKPAATLLHLGPGLGNGLANLHNARRARSPIVNIVGDHATRHREYDAPLASDVAGVAAPMSHWVATSESADDLPVRGAEAMAAAQAVPGQVATLIVPADHAWDEASGPAKPIMPAAPRVVSGQTIDGAVKILSGGGRIALLLGGAALRGSALRDCGRIAEATGAELLRETFSARVERGAGRVAVEALPYFGEAAAARLKDIDALVLVGAKAPVSFFAYPGKPGWLAPEGCVIHAVAEPGDDLVAAVATLADALKCAKAPRILQARASAEVASGALNANNLAAVIANHIPEHAIISDEGATAGSLLPAHTAGSAPHDWLQLTGGSIGQGIPVATGAAVACPDRKVLCVQGDGGGMYTLQALWTQAREGLDVTTIILANRSYAILNIEFSRVGAGEPGEKARDMLDLTRPTLDWVKLSEGMGVDASRATTAEEFDAQLKEAVDVSGPRLIEVVL